ncbi:MAG: phosphate ABC transporter permease PstA [Candidatus Edwardsbacteria bacterium]|nr:phosphate ABC transporter permease PstA [Candidatus Edwardsbacteria bacterium]MBU1577607.1 phosphate ABC transporter permease PstA [Candidatus Edwardsbacteria bacterium]MBU2462946.1 phosphate ABC transporter permease PstA [Candidatus Edwardsbacteria bacterium]MBU2595113.1 phosphate ABC transporter permease PstA [Candidatus Edwardsbacteria bacterium]
MNLRNIKDKLKIGLTGSAVLLILAILVIILGTVIIGGYKSISWEFLTQAPTEGMTKGGIFPAIFGMVFSLLLMLIAVVPIGVATAVYLHEYARPGFILTKLIRGAVNNLAGVPSIVFGLFGLGFFIQFIGGGLDRSLGQTGLFGQPCILWASLTLALMNLPMIIVATEEALRAIPQAERAGALALGATKWQSIRHVVLPQAIPGILTGVVLVISRGAGEVAPIMFTGAAYYLPYLPKLPTDQFMTLGYHIFVMTTQSPDIDATMPIAMGATLVLLALTFSLNIIAIIIRSRTRSQLRKGR